MLETRGWTAVVLLSLALGIGANTALFSAVNGLLLQTVPVPDPETLVRLKWTGDNDMVRSSSDYGTNLPAGVTNRTSFVLTDLPRGILAAFIRPLIAPFVEDRPLREQPLAIHLHQLVFIVPEPIEDAAALRVVVGVVEPVGA